MKEIIDFGKYKGKTYLEVPIDYLVYMEKIINKDKLSGQTYDKDKLETIEYWLNERYIENDAYDKNEAWNLEQEKAQIKREEPKQEFTIKVSPDNIAKHMIQTYGNELSILIADSIKAQTVVIETIYESVDMRTDI